MDMDFSEVVDEEVLESDSFACIIDKGTLDCVACGEENSGKVRQMIKNVLRVHMPGGVFICFCHARP